MKQEHKTDKDSQFLGAGWNLGTEQAQQARKEEKKREQAPTGRISAAELSVSGWNLG